MSYSTKPYSVFSKADKIGISFLVCVAMGCIFTIVQIVHATNAGM